MPDRRQRLCKVKESHSSNCPGVQPASNQFEPVPRPDLQVCRHRQIPASKVEPVWAQLTQPVVGRPGAARAVK